MTVGSKACHWEFLLPWFMELKELISAYTGVTRLHSHPVRIGVNIEDWWIQVHLNTVDGVRKTPAQLRTIREALLIVGAFGQLHHGVCWQDLQSFSLFAPEPHMDLDNPKFAPRFVIEMAEFFDTGESISSSFDTKVAVDAFFTMEALSDDFKRDWARIVEIRMQYSRTPIDVKPVELYLVVEFSGTTFHPLNGSVIIECIKAMQDRLRGRARMNLSDRLHLEPVFSITSIDLFVFNAPLTAQDLDLLRQLVELGIRMGTVRSRHGTRKDLRKTRKAGAGRGVI